MIMKIYCKFKQTFLFKCLFFLRYLFIRYILNKRIKRCYLYHDLKIIPVDKGINFFGYYNLHPTNGSCETLFLKVQHEDSRGSCQENAKIMKITSMQEKKMVAETAAWNWQQGAMLQWYPKGSNTIIFNNYNSIDDCYEACHSDLSGNVIKTYSAPIYTINHEKKHALTLNFDRLRKMRPDYAYFNRKGTEIFTDDKDGVFKLDFISNKVELILSLKTLRELSYVDIMEDAEHKVNHLEYNPSGTRFMFLHRWVGPKGRYTRLLTSDENGENLKILNGDIMTSHSCWLDDDRIVAFCEYNDKTGYYMFNDKTGEVKLFSNQLPLVDGHPSLSPDGKYLLTDTYPDKSRFSSLLLLDIKANKLITLGLFKQALRYRGEKRIDLHPKWGLDSKSIYFESGHNGRRNLFKMELK